MIALKYKHFLLLFILGKHKKYRKVGGCCYSPGDLENLVVEVVISGWSQDILKVAWTGFTDGLDVQH